MINPNYSTAKQKGFTMIDLLVTITIMVVLGSIGTSVALQSIAKNRLISSADLVVSTLDSARSKSLGGIDGGAWAVEITATNPPTLSYYCFTCDPATRQTRTTNLHESITITPPPSGNLIIFGQLTGYVHSPDLSTRQTENLSMKLENDKNNITIQIPPSGKIYVDQLQ